MGLPDVELCYAGKTNPNRGQAFAGPAPMIDIMSDTAFAANLLVCCVSAMGAFQLDCDLAAPAGSRKSGQGIPDDYTMFRP